MRLCRWLPEQDGSFNFVARWGRKNVLPGLAAALREFAVVARRLAKTGEGPMTGYLRRRQIGALRRARGPKLFDEPATVSATFTFGVSRKRRKPSSYPQDLRDVSQFGRSTRSSCDTGLLMALRGDVMGLYFSRSKMSVVGGQADIANAMARCPFMAAGSTGRRNTSVKSLCWGFKLQGLTWPFVELTSHFVQIGLRAHRQVSALREVLSQ